MKLFGFFFLVCAGLSANAETFSLVDLCEKQATAKVEKSFIAEGWNLGSSEIVSRRSTAKGAETLVIETVAYLTGPYDGSKTSTYEITMSLKGNVCTIGEPLLTSDDDIAD